MEDRVINNADTVRNEIFKLKKMATGNSKKISVVLIKYLIRNAYLKVSATGINPLLLQYLYSIDKDYIRKFTNVDFSRKSNGGIVSYNNKIKRFSSTQITHPEVTNIVRVDLLNYIYYSVESKEHSGSIYNDLSINIYFFGPKRYIERSKMLQFCADYKLFLRKKKLAKRFEHIEVRPYQRHIDILDITRLPAKNYTDIISKYKDDITDAVTNWNKDEMKKWYEEHNIIHKYNLLLYGPPGTGKTSLIYYLASVLRRYIYVIDLSLKLEDLKKEKLKEYDAEQAIIIIEDIDISLNIKDKSDEQKQIVEDKIQWLMQVLDGTESIPNAIIIITTNKYDDIDQRLLRKGRIDKQVEIGYFDRDEMQEMCDNFKVNIDDIVSENIQTIQPVELQSLIREHLFKTIQKEL